MQNITTFVDLDIESARKAFTHATSILSKQTIGIRRAVLVQTHIGDTSGRKDLFSVCTHTENAFCHNGQSFLMVTIFSEVVDRSNAGQLAVIGDFGQWILKSAT